MGDAARVIDLEPYVAADDVVRQLGCARASAYRHLRRAAGRLAGARGLLRVSVRVWSDYLERMARRGSTSAVESGGRGSTPKGSGSRSARAATTGARPKREPPSSSGTPPIRLVHARGTRP